VKSPRTDIIEVAMPLPLDTTFHYRVPQALAAAVKPGKRVFVPFRGRKLTGYVLAWAGEVPGELKDVIEVLDAEPLFTPGELAFYRWAAAYYLHPLGEVIKAALPAGINLKTRRFSAKNADGSIVAEDRLTGGKSIRTETVYRALPSPPEFSLLKGKAAQILEFLNNVGEAPRVLVRRNFGDCSQQLKKLVGLGLIAEEKREVYRDPFREEVFEQESPLVLNENQSKAFKRITGAIDDGIFSPFLLHGVTGSGKTEVYLHIIAHCLGLGRNALVLVPEIALTPQLVRRFKSRFRCGIAVLHSGLSAGERYDEWRRIRRGEVSIVIGARSAIFAPLENTGVIVVDEEHEASYKQTEGFTYNARDLALVRGKMENSAVVLGSATPLITTYYSALQGRLEYLELPERTRNLPLPDARIIDARGRKGETFLPELVTALADNLAGGGQSLLFLNRRGFATFLVCRDCGHVFRCPNCSVTLTYHRIRQRHFCHYCDFSLPAPSVCPGCGGAEIVLLGRGTERVEEEVKALFPEARVARMDSDTTSGKGGHARILKKLEEGSIDILIGTQMIAKGHDYPGVTLVGVISADTTLNLPDFRSAERTFQIISQVTGRAGRGNAPGKVLIQSLSPDHYALVRAAAHDFPAFYSEEIEFRREAGYPPFTFLATVNLSGNSDKAVEKCSEEAAGSLRQIRQRLGIKIEVLGPAPAPMAKIRGRYRRQIMLKSPSRRELNRFLSVFRSEFKPKRDVRINVDMDPVDML
jgi:primosomal protein N' (replication factor Y)